jgi:topoisomerase-4 subunit A
MMGADEDLYLLTTDRGYGFIAPLGELHTKNRKGKATLRVPPGARVLKPQRVSDPEQDWLAVITTSGHLLVYLADELPRMARGKGVKMINIPSKRLKSGEERVLCAVTLREGSKSGEERVLCAVTLREGSQLIIHSGKRYLRLKSGDLEHYWGERGLRGRKLPRGFQQVRTADVE